MKTTKEAAAVEQTVAVQGEYITLGQMLKIAGIIESGGAAKSYLADTILRVNGEPEQRRGRKLRPGDLVVMPDGETVRLTESGENNDADA